MIFRFDRFQADDAAFRLTADGAPVSLEPKTLRLLLYLIQNRGRLLRKQEILDAVWADAAVAESALTRSVGLLRKTLDDDSREPRFIETVPTAGYRFIAEVVEIAPELPVTAPASTPTFATQPQPEAKALTLRPRLRPGFIAGACLILVIAAAWLLVSRLQAARAIHSLAVLPLENLSGDPSQDYFADGTTDELITELARIPALRVVSRTSSMQDKGAHKSLAQIASELNVEAIVEGSVVRSGDRVRITAQLVDTRTDRHLWAQSFEGSTSDILSLQDSVASQIAAETRLVLSPSDQPPARSVNPAAHDAYLRGRYFFQKDDFQRSAAAFQQAISIDPSYASAYAGLADALDAQTTFGMVRPEDAMPRAIAAAQHAIQLDPRNGEAYEALGSIQTIYLWDWRDAETNLTRAIALNPSYALAEMKYAALLDAIDRPQEAVSHMRRAVSLDPLSFFMNRRLAATLYLARDYDGAVAQFRRAMELEPDQAVLADAYESRIYRIRGMHDQAVEDDLHLLQFEFPKLDIAALRADYQRGGWNAFLAARSHALDPYVAKACVPYEQSIDSLQLGDRNGAFQLLNRAIDQHCFWMTWTQVDPLLDSLRNDPRYPLLLRRLNLPA